MIKFVNAKINLGLQIVRKREDGYHDLQTVFYPIGKFAGTAENPVQFCDILEIARLEKAKEDNFPEILFGGRKIECPPEKNLVFRAVKIFCEETCSDFSRYSLMLEKHLPDGAGLGGGSADAGFTLRLLSDIYKRENPANPVSDKDLYGMALKLGADCPFFLLNRPAYAEGVGEKLEEISLDLGGYWLLVVKPAVYVSTKDAFSGVFPHESDFDLRRIVELPVEEWEGLVKNDFEESIFPQYPLIKDVKSILYDKGALYASMSGSGSSVYGIFSTKDIAERAESVFKGNSTIEGSYLLKM